MFPILGNLLRSRRSPLHLRPTVLLLSVPSLLLMAACGGKDSITGPSIAEVAGARTMRTADGKGLPTTFVDGSGKQLTIKSGALTITSDGHFDLHYVGSLGSLQFDLHEEGTVKVANGALTFTPDDDSSVFTGTSAGSQIVAKFKIAGVAFSLGFAP